MGRVVREVLQLVRVGVLFVLAANFTWGYGEGTPCCTVSVNENVIYFLGSFLLSLCFLCTVHSKDFWAFNIV